MHRDVLVVKQKELVSFTTTFLGGPGQDSRIDGDSSRENWSLGFNSLRQEIGCRGEQAEVWRPHDCRVNVRAFLAHTSVATTGSRWCFCFSTNWVKE